MKVVYDTFSMNLLSNWKKSIGLPIKQTFYGTDILETRLSYFSISLVAQELPLRTTRFYKTTFNHLKFK